MATTKTLTPTNQAITLAAFTEKPDNRTNVTNDDRLADAVNTLNSNLTPKTKTVTGTTQNNGTLNLSLNNNTNYVVSVKDNDARYRVQAICAGQGWYAIVTTDDATPTAIVNTEVTLIVRYFPR